MGELTFRCRSCGGYGDVLAERRPDWASVAGFDSCAEWLALDEATDLAACSLRRHPPVAGDVCTLRVRYPFRLREGAAFWALFRPAFAAINGWFEAPDEIDLSCLIACRHSETVAMTDEAGSIRIEVGEVVPIAGLAARFEPRLGGTLPPYPASRGERFDQGDLRVSEWNFEGDAGAWFVCQQGEEGWVLLLMGEWGHGYDFFYAGPRPLTESEAGGLSIA